METKQTTQMVAWLDEERRKDKALIIKLEERVAAQTALLEDQTRRIQTLEGDLAAMRTTALSISTFDESISRLRAEVNATLEQAQQRGSPDQDVKKIRDVVREGTVKAVDDLRQEMLTRIDRELQPRRAEEERLARVAVELQNYADNLSKGFEEFQRSLTFLEEQRRQDSRRLSDIHSELTETGKRIESQQAKSELLEDLSRRNERSVTELSTAVLELKQQRQTWLEQETMAEQQRERSLSEALRRLEDNLKTFNKQAEVWTETQRTMKKQVEDFERLVDRVDRRLNEVAETQRLSEERFRHEWEEFQQEDQKRFRQFTLTNEEAWRANDRFTQTTSEQLASLTERSEQMADYLKHLTSLQEGVLEVMMSQFQTMRDELSGKAKSLLP